MGGHRGGGGGIGGGGDVGSGSSSSAGGGGGGGGGGVVSHLSYSVTPTLALSAVVSTMPIASIGATSKIRHNDKTTPDKAPSDSSKHNSLGERASSKLTLDDELFDILYAFG